jgi:hypothetical protein
MCVFHQFGQIRIRDPPIYSQKFELWKSAHALLIFPHSRQNLFHRISRSDAICMEIEAQVGSLRFLFIFA